MLKTLDKQLYFETKLRIEVRAHSQLKGAQVARASELGFGDETERTFMIISEFCGEKSEKKEEGEVAKLGKIGGSG